MFYNISDKLKEEFIKNLKSSSKKYNKESKNFIEDILTEKEGESEYYHFGNRYSYMTETVFENKILQKIEKMENVTLQDIFPEQIEAGLQGLLGEEYSKVFRHICREIIHYPYTYGYDRKPVRSRNYKYYFARLMDLLELLNRLYLLELDVSNVLKNEYDKTKIYLSNIPELIAAKIDLEDEEVISLIKEMMTSENNHAILSYDVLKGIFMSKNHELLELSKKLLLAAKLQEGLRQSICETMDGGRFENFKEMFEVVYDNDLLRFSSVKRALGTWTGIGDFYYDRINKKELQIIKKLTQSPEYAQELLKSTDNVELYLGLWAKGNVEVEDAIQQMEHIIENGQKHNLLLVSYYLQFTSAKDKNSVIARQMIQKYPDDMEIFACFHPLLFFKNNYYFRRFLDGIKEKKELKSSCLHTREEGYALVKIFRNHIASMKSKQICLEPCIFPWYSVRLEREDVISSLFALIYLLDDEDLKDDFTQYIKYADSYRRADMISTLYSNPKGKKQEEYILSAMADRNIDSDVVFGIAKKHNLMEKYRGKIEDLLRLKTQEIRNHTIEMLYSQSDEDLESSIGKLLLTKDEQKRLGALDLLVRAKKEERFDKAKIKNFLKDLEHVSSSEQILIDVLLEEKSASNITQIDYDEEYDRRFQLQYPDEGKVSKMIGKAMNLLKKKEASEVKVNGCGDALVVEMSDGLEIRAIFQKSEEELLDIVRKLSDLIEEHEDYEYKNAWGYETLISKDISPVKLSENESFYRANLESLPLAEIWEGFYKEHIGDFKTLFQLYVQLNIPISGYAYNYEKAFEEVTNKCLGFDVYSFARKLEKEEIKYKERHIKALVGALFRRYEEEEPHYAFLEGLTLYKLLYQRVKPKEMILPTTRTYMSKEYDCILHEVDLFKDANVYIRKYFDDDSFTQSFAIRWEIEHELNDYANQNVPEFELSLIDFYEIIKAIEIGLLKPDIFYKRAFCEIDYYVREISEAFYGPRYSYGRFNQSHKNQYIINERTKEFAKEHGRKVLDYILDLELRRGDSPTPYSTAIKGIQKVEGTDRFIGILLALGKENLDRSSYYYGANATKKSNLSRLLRVSEPLEGEDAQMLRTKLKKVSITDKRLIEASMYAPKWVQIIQEYLGWKGMASGCYYFQAHTSDADAKMEGIFGTYSPISIERFKDGAFDIDWFKSAYKDLGSEHFELLYDAAKYISDGSKHSRARMFADAVIGKLDLKESEEKILDKRNQNLVMSYSLIPLAKKKEEDILRRYKFLQKFLKDSKQFGAQRRASESKAVEISLENLARNAGFEDVTRLTCMAETQMISQWKGYFEPKTLEDIEVYISIDKDGKSQLVCQKAGKILKSLPAKHKKSPYVQELKEIHKNLKDQYVRAKKLFEHSMEDGVVFYAKELQAMMKNPVIAPILKDLVFVNESTLGFFDSEELGLIPMDEKSASLGEIVKLKAQDGLKIAHALDFYHAGTKVWANYQAYLFEHEIKQAFKQIFRELYVKTRDEEGKEHSLRYAGHQIQPAKTIAMLKSRRWIIDNEEGLQKVYYKKDVIAKIYALADWFSPSDIEAPTLEWVCFYNRKDLKPLKIDDVPDLIFTEVMRDVDLAVSVAHVGGVDPEASHSTVEMRKAIFGLNLKLFKLKNVEFTDSHALIKGKLGEYSIHLGSGVVHQKAGSTIHVLPVHSQHRGRIFLPFVDEDPKTAEIMSKILFFAQDEKIKDPFILEQLL